MERATPKESSDQFVFDAEHFANTLVSMRTERGWSTRELAKRASISQPYVVALERSRTPGSKIGPSPTVDTITQLAAAFQIDVTELFRKSIRAMGKHVLLIHDQSEHSSLEIAKIGSGKDLVQWMCAGSCGESTHSRMSHIPISLHRDASKHYKPAAIKQSLIRELQFNRAEIAGNDIGLIFGETSNVMSQVDNPMALIDFEQEWPAVVNTAARSAGAHASWNICVYSIDDVRSLDDSGSAIKTLLRSHGEIWYARNKSLIKGTNAVTKILSSI
jgi:hypothetical protein